MTNTEALKQNFILILGLGALALIRPLMKITGLIDLIGQQFGSILLTILISLAWLLIVVKKNIQKPILILVFAGISYAIFATIISGILSPILLGQLQGPLTNPLGFISVIVTNIIWGLIVGGIALAIRNKVKD
ncbi:hypothetical protein SAMN05444392_108140 [Seinonella peptonophila]|uniref:Uncharacterized protein n=1 Tax=Seinonella peptonophila TaxID=112248 RepID=A0A1M4ZAQ8_9BACL|nr:hypothetical protein [Seinonella peptonophila]SHF15133.1 hypothetical protein SAMN05444392_108140 [Seinonella peptonophila]